MQGIYKESSIQANYWWKNKMSNKGSKFTAHSVLPVILGQGNFLIKNRPKAIFVILML